MRPTAARACWPITTRRRSLLTSPSSPGATVRTSFGSSRRRRFAGCGGPPSSRWRVSTSTTPSRSFTAPPSSRRAMPAVWHAIGRVNALKFDGEAMWPAMQKAIELTDGTEELADLYAELTFESSCAAGCGSGRSTTRWSRPGLPARSSWPMPGVARVPERSSPRRCREDDGRTGGAGGRALAERLDDPVLLSYAYWARSGDGVRRSDFHEADRWRNAASSSSTA